MRLKFQRTDVRGGPHIRREVWIEIRAKGKDIDRQCVDFIVEEVMVDGKAKSIWSRWRLSGSCRLARKQK